VHVHVTWCTVFTLCWLGILGGGGGHGPLAPPPNPPITLLILIDMLQSKCAKYNWIYTEGRLTRHLRLRKPCIRTTGDTSPAISTLQQWFFIFDSIAIKIYKIFTNNIIKCILSDRSRTSSHSSFIVIMAIFCIVSEIKRNIGWKSLFFTPLPRWKRLQIFSHCFFSQVYNRARSLA